MRHLRISKPTPLSVSLARFSSAVVVSAAIMAAATAHAATKYWDADGSATGNKPNGANLGGSGIWDTGTTSNFWDGSSETTWANGDTAIFTGASDAFPATVTLGAGGITASHLFFQSSGYVLAGTGGLTINSGGSIVFNAPLGIPVTTTIAAPITAVNGFRFAGKGGTLILNGDQTGIASAITLESGTIRVARTIPATEGGPTTPATLSTIGLTFKGTSKFEIDNTSETAALTRNFGVLTLTGGDGNIQVTRGVNQNVVVTFTSSARSAGATLLLSANGNSAAIGGTANTKITVTGTTAGAGIIMPGVFVSTGVGASSLAYYDGTNNAVVPYTDYNVANQGQSVSGTFNPSVNRHILVTGNTTLSASGTIQSLAFSTTSTLSLNSGTTLTIAANTSGGNNLGPATFLKTGANASVIQPASGTATLTAGGTGEYIIRVDDAAGSLAINSGVTLTGSALTKSGPGTLTISGTNSITGATFVNDGKLTINGTGGLGGTAAIQLNGGTYELLAGNNNNTTESVTTNKSVVVNASSTLAAARVTASTSSQNKTHTYTTLSIGNQTLTVDPETATFGVAFSGTTTLTDALPATFNVTGTQAAGVIPGLTLTGQVTGATSSGIVKTGTGTLTLASSSNNFGATGASVVIQGGILAVAADGALGAAGNRLVLDVESATEGLRATGSFTSTRPIVLAQSGAIEVGSGLTLTLNGTIASIASAGFTKQGTGTLSLGGTNTFGGAGSTLSLAAGSLVITSPGALGSVENVRIGVTGTTSSGNEFNVTATSPVTTAANFDLTNATSTAFNRINVVNASGSLQIDGAITSATTTANLYKTGAGNLILTNPANSFGGTGTIFEVGNGSLTVTDGGALGDPNNQIRLSIGGTNHFRASGTSTARQTFLLNGPSAATTFEVDAGETFTLVGPVNNSSAANDLVKVGTGTLILGNNSDAFGGTGKIIDIQQGILGALSDGALGNASNTIKLSGTVLGQGFSAAGSFSTTRSIQLASATANTIGVTQGNVLTLGTAFNVTGNTAAPLLKNDLGTLVLTQNQPSWTGTLTIDAGAVRLGSSAATNTLLGTGAGGTVISNLGSLELSLASSTVTLKNEAISIVPTGDNTVMVGSSFAGVIRVGAGASGTIGVIDNTNTITITGVQTNGNTRSVLFGSDSGGTAQISAPIAINHTATTGTFNLRLGGDSTTDNLFASAITTNQAGIDVNLVKTGGGKWLLNAVQSAVDNVVVENGIFQVRGTADGTGSGTGTILPSTATVRFNASGTFLYDNTSATVAKTQTLAGISLSAGDGRLEISRVASQNAFVVSNSAVARSVGATGIFAISGSSPTYGSNVRFTMTGALAGFYDSGVFSATSATNSTGFSWYDTGTQTLRPIAYSLTGAGDLGAWSYSSGATIAADRYTQLGTGLFNSGGTPITIRSLHLSGNANFSVATDVTINTVGGSGGAAAGGLLKTGSTPATISGVGSIGAGAGNELVIRVDGATDSLVISTAIANTGALTKSGAGTLTLSGNNTWTGPTYVNGGTLSIQGSESLSGSSVINLSGGTFTYAENGDNTGQPQSGISVGKDLVINGNAGITVARRSNSLYALNKTIDFNSLSIDDETLTITGTNGYGAAISGSTVLNDAVAPNFNVAATQASDVNAGFTLAGIVSSTNPVGFIKSGTGTLALTNSGNTFGGPGAVIEVRGGFVAASSDGALGNEANSIILNVSGTNQGFRATGTFATDRGFTIAQNFATFEVTQGNVFTINTPIDFVSSAAALTKNDNGVLELAADVATSWTGAINLNAGALRLKTGGALGSTNSGRLTLPATPGAAVQLSGDDVIYSAYPLTLNTTGINNGGGLENVSGNNTWTGPITLSAATGATIGSSSGTLTLGSTITASAASTQVTFAGEGNIRLTALLPTSNLSTVNKVGNGTLTLTAANSSFTGAFVVNDGTLAISGVGARIGGTGAFTIRSGGTVTIDDTSTALANRLGGRAVTFNGGNLTILGNSAANTSETLASGTAFTRGLTTITLVPGTGRSITLTFAGAIANLAPAQNAGTPPNGASVLFRGTSLGTAPGANVATVTTNSSTGWTFNGQNGAVNTITKGILPWALVDADPNGFGTSFATADSTTGRLRALNTQEISNALAASANVYLSNTTTLSARTFNINALNFSPTLNSLTFQPGGNLKLDTSEGIVFLVLSSGGILARGNNTIENSNPSLSNGVINAASGSSPLNIWTPGTASLDIKVAITGGNGASATGLVKSGAGTLTLSGPVTPIAEFSPVYAGLSSNTFNALTTINEGTLKLASGTNTLFPNTFLHIAAGGALDLAGNSQYVQSLFNDATVAGNGGIVTSSTGTGTLVLNSDATRTFAGSITGPVNFLRSGVSTGTYTMLSDNSLSGIVQISGGTTILKDNGTFSNASAVNINYATLTLDNTGTAGSSSRINDTAPVTMRGGAITLAGRPLMSIVEELGALTVTSGLSTLTSNVSSGAALGTNVASADLNFASLTRVPGTMVNFVGQINGASTHLGTYGSSPRITFDVAPTLTQNIIGGWAIATGRDTAAGVDNIPEFASYVPGLGIGPLGANGYRGYDSTDLPSAAVTANVRVAAGSPVTLSGDKTVNALNITGVSGTPPTGETAGTVLLFSSDELLNIVSGGLIRGGSTGTTIIGAAPAGKRGRLTSGGTDAGLSELSIYQGNANITLRIYSQIVDNGVGTTALVLGGPTGTIDLGNQVSNTYSGGTTINTIAVNTNSAAPGVVVFPAGGLTINDAAVSVNAPGRIDPSNSVTLNGGATLTLNGDNTLVNLNFNNPGGTSRTPMLQTTGTLTLTGTVSATSSNPTTTSTLAGRINLDPGNPNIFDVEPITLDGVSIAPTQAALALQGIQGSGGIVKTGAGVLQFNVQDVFTGDVIVQEGGVQFGGGSTGSRFATINLAGTGTLLNANGQSTVIGGLSGNGVVTNSSPTGVNLQIGFNNQNTTFSGRFLRFGDGIANSLNVYKIGTGKLTLDGNGNTTTGNLYVYIGEVAYTGAGTSTFVNNLPFTGGTLTLDNSVTNTNNRFGGLVTSSTLDIRGGTLNLIGNASASTTETIDTLTVQLGAGVINLLPNPNQPLTLNIVTSFTGVTAGGTLLINNLSAVDGPGKGTIDGATLNLNPPAGVGTNFPPSQGAIRPDIIAFDGVNYGFITKDLNSLDPAQVNNIRLLKLTGSPGTSELLTAMTSGASTPTNYQFSSVQSIAENTRAYSVVLKETAGIQSIAPANYGRYGPNGSVLSQTVISGGILVPPSSNTSITVPLLTTGQNVPLTFHVLDGSTLTVTGDVSVGAANALGTHGLAKSGTGTLTINGRGFYSGATTVNEGTLILNGGKDQAIAVAPAQTAATLSALNMNGGTLDLSGYDQAFGQLQSNNPYPGFGGTITSATPAMLITATPNSPTYAGVMSGQLGFEKQGNGSQILTGVSTYTGPTIVRGGSIYLRDAGQLQNTSGITVYYGQFVIDNSGATSPDAFTLARIKNDAPITLYGGALTFQAGGSSAYSATLASQVKLKSGANAINANDSTGSTSVFTLGSLVREDEYATLNFTGSSLGNITGFISKILFALAPTQTNNIIGPWAIVNGSDFAAVSTDDGRIGGLSNTTGGFAGYSATSLSGVTASSNVTIGGNATLAANTSVNVLRITGTTTITQTAGTTLNFAGGGLLANAALTMGASANQGSITAGTDSLFAYINVASQINSSIVGNINFVKSGAAQLTLTGNNSHTGDTVVNQGALVLNNTSADGNTNVAVPGRLLVNGGVTGTPPTVTLSLPGQIRQTSTVSIVGAGTVTFNGQNTVARLEFNNLGSGANPQVNTASALTLTSPNAIDAVNESLTTTPVIAGTTLVLSDANPVISAGGNAATSLLISAPIHSAGGTITKDGPGFVALNPNVVIGGTTVSGSDIITLPNGTDFGLANGMTVTGTGIPAGAYIVDVLGTNDNQVQISIAANLSNTSTTNFTFGGSTVNTGFRIAANGGGLVLGSSSVVDPSNSSVILSGPVGVGDLTIEDEGALMSDGTIRTLHNNIIAPEDIVLGTPTGSTKTALPGNSVILAGNLVLGDNVSHTVTVNGLTNTSTLNGELYGFNAPLIKAGEGTLVLGNTSNGTNWTGSFSVVGGVLRSGAAGAIPAGAEVAVATGGAFDIGASDQYLSKITGTGVVGSSGGSYVTLYVGGDSAYDTTTDASSLFQGSIAGLAPDFANPSTLNLTKVGLGTFTLAGKNFISGSVNVNSGTLAVTSTGELQMAETVTVNAESTLEIHGKLSGTLTGGGLTASGENAVVSGDGIIDVNTFIGSLSVLAPQSDGVHSLTITNRSLDLSDEAVLVYQALPSLTGKVLISGVDSLLTLPSGLGWTLKIENLGIENPTGMRFVLFEGINGAPLLNGNFDFTDDVGFLIGGAPDFSATDWMLDPDDPDAGVHFDPDTNQIYLTGVIPEPSVAALLVGALGGAMGFRRMRRRQ